jgi:hypothetical protein
VGDLVTTITSSIGALGVGSVVGQYLGSRRDRLTARADVLGALSDVENSRWANLATWPEFKSAATRLQTAALIARLPRKPFNTYLQMARAARWESSEGYDETGEDQEAGIDGDLAECIRAIAERITDLVWARFPQTKAQRVAPKIEALYDEALKQSRDSTNRFLQRSRKLPA